MTDTRTRQHPIGTGFTAASTVDGVLAGIDLTGTDVVITGGHTGLGWEMTRARSQAGASITVAARDPAKAARAVEGRERVRTHRLGRLDPASLDALLGQD